VFPFIFLMDAVIAVAARSGFLNEIKGKNPVVETLERHHISGYLGLNTGFFHTLREKIDPVAVIEPLAHRLIFRAGQQIAEKRTDE